VVIFPDKIFNHGDTKAQRSLLECGPVRHLLIAGCLHIALAIVIFFAGHFQLLPGVFDQNGIGLSFAIDGASYQRLASDLVDTWQANGFSAWLNVNAPLHARLYSLSFATLGKVTGHNILAAEPLNLLYYLGILFCIYLLGREAFNRKTGLLAASIVGAWPSFLLHSTQLVRDSLAILCFLALIVVLTLLLKREFHGRNGGAVGAAGVTFAALCWLVRGNMWNVVLAAIAITILMLVYRMIREKRFMTANVAVMLLIAAAALFIPARLESSTLPGVTPPTTPLAIRSAAQPAPAQGIWNRTFKQIAQRRAGFRSYTARASNIDEEVHFNSAGDALRFIPRAAVIGFFAPFPKMWFERGSLGRAARILSGLETLAMYFLYLAAGYCLWRERRNLQMWLLFLVAAIGMVGLGLVVVNAGALFRIRYVFWMMLIVLAAEGLRKLPVSLPLWLFTSTRSLTTETQSHRESHFTTVRT
jgi:4-amino-4-deoxy-L-arabinose transferase-like glycosyltransferase